jgi:hypothetical protein
VLLEVVKQVLAQLLHAGLGGRVHDFLGAVVGGQHDVPGQPLRPARGAVVEDLADGVVAEVPEQQQVPGGAVGVAEGELHGQGGVVAGGGAVVLERRVHERLERRAHVLAVERGDRLARVGEVGVGQLCVGVLIAVDVVADDPDVVAAGRLPAGSVRLQRGRDPPLGLGLERLGVLAQLHVVLEVFTPEPRRRPQLADVDPVQQVGEAGAVVDVAVGEGEPGQVRLVVAGRQVFDEPVDHRGDQRVLLVGGGHVPQVHLQDVLLVDHHRGRVAAADRPEHHAPLGQPRVGHPYSFSSNTDSGPDGPEGKVNVAAWQAGGSCRATAEPIRYPLTATRRRQQPPSRWRAERWVEAEGRAGEVTVEDACAVGQRPDGDGAGDDAEGAPAVVGALGWRPERSGSRPRRADG